MSKAEQTYLDLCKDVMENGEFKGDRTGTGTISDFGPQVKYDLKEGFPLLTTKRVSFRLIASELLWFIKGITNIKFLLEHKNHIWDEWAFENYINSEDYHGPDMTDFGLRSQKDAEFNKIYKEELKKFREKILNDEEFCEKYGDLGPVYGKQWRNWESADGTLIDQLKDVIEEIKRNPNSRRLIVSAWNPGEVKKMALPPCHSFFQFYVRNNRISLKLYQRSCDLFLGCPFNIASYMLLLMLVANECGLEVGEFIHTFGDVHVYTNHIEQFETQFEREMRPLPNVVILAPVGTSIFDITMDDIVLEGYDPHDAIYAPVAV